MNGDKAQCDCGHVAVASEHTTGYGVDNEGKKHCFDCCGKRDEKAMQETGKACLYLEKEKGHYVVTNWPGTLKIEPFRVRQGMHNIAGSRIDVWFNHGGKTWHGVQYGEWTQIIHCKRNAA